MTNADSTQNNSVARVVPIVAIAAIAVLGYFLMRDYLNFETLRQNRELLVGLRDDNYVFSRIVHCSLYGDSNIFSAGGGCGVDHRRVFVCDLSGHTIQCDCCDQRCHVDLSGGALGIW